MKIRVKLVFITSFIHHEMSKILIEKGIEGINGGISGEIGKTSVNARKISKIDIRYYFRVGIPLSILYYRTASTKFVRDQT